MSYQQDPYTVEGIKPAAHHHENQDDNKDEAMKGGIQGMTLEDRATALAMAQKADPGLDPRSWRMFVFTMIILCACMCSGDNGTSRTPISRCVSHDIWQASTEQSCRRSTR